MSGRRLEPAGLLPPCRPPRSTTASTFAHRAPPWRETFERSAVSPALALTYTWLAESASPFLLLFDPTHTHPSIVNFHHIKAVMKLLALIDERIKNKEMFGVKMCGKIVFGKVKFEEQFLYAQAETINIMCLKNQP